MFDIIIRCATLVDGTGAGRRTADVAIANGLIVAVGEVNGPADREIDARGLIVTPGFVDIHTHYDGQASWDAEMAPSSWHGVTTVVMGSCGVGFAPAKPDRHDWLIGLMEGVEDIPGAALHEGLTWDWETFPEYMDALDRLPRTIDIAVQVPHGALRAYVMGDRALGDAPADCDDIARMKSLVLESLNCGAVGFSTSRTMFHISRDGEPVPGTFAAEDELFGIGQALGEAGHGVFQMVSGINSAEFELDWMSRLSKATGAVVMQSIAQFHSEPESWRTRIAAMERANADGARVYAGVAVRGLGMLLSWEANLHPFYFCPSFQPLIVAPPEERNAILRDPAFRTRLLAEAPIFNEDFSNGDDVISRREMLEGVTFNYANMYCLEGDSGIDYEPTCERSVAAIADATGRDPREVIYDILISQDGRGILYYPVANYAYGNYDHVPPMLDSPATVVSLSDGGAHVGVMCDASIPTYLLTHWVRDRSRGGRLSLERAVQLQTSDTAAIYGFDDRGTIEVGKRADINIIDFDRLDTGVPEMRYDLPTGAKRFLQKPAGYVATIVAGQIVWENGRDTGARPGRLIRAASGKRGGEDAPIVSFACVN